MGCLNGIQTFLCCLRDIFQDVQVEIIVNDHGNRTTPSCVVFSEGERLIGEAAKNMVAVNPTNTIYESKRLIGHRFYDSVVQEDMIHWSFQVIYIGSIRLKLTLIFHLKSLHFIDI
ncbi:MAG: Hsp70 family protein [bacterium]